MFGVAVLASIFAANGSYETGQAFVDGMIPAMQVGAVVVAIGAVAALALRGRVQVAIEPRGSTDDAPAPIGAPATM